MAEYKAEGDLIACSFVDEREKEHCSSFHSLVMLPRTTTTDVSTTNPRRCTKFSLSMSFERYSCLVVHLIILVMIYFHLDKLNRKQEDLIVTYRSTIERQR